jgi:hypothetical protein
VYNIHCISERAQTLREDPKYEFLKSHDFKDPVLNKRRDNVFSGKYADGDIVGFPERENVVLISGQITAPVDGSRFIYVFKSFPSHNRLFRERTVQIKIRIIFRNFCFE